MIDPKINRDLSTATTYNPTFCENRFKTFRIIPLMDKQTEKHGC